MSGIDGRNTSAHIFISYDSKITEVYKAKDNSGFFGAF